MKKILLIALTALSLTSCNQNIGWGNFYYTKVHIFGQRCYDIKSWRDNGDKPGIEVETKDYGWIFLSEGNYMLVENECPICDYHY